MIDSNGRKCKGVPDLLGYVLLKEFDYELRKVGEPGRGGRQHYLIRGRHLDDTKHIRVDGPPVFWNNIDS